MNYIKYLDMFRAILCSYSGGQNCISTASDIVTLCERPCSAPVESGLQTALNTFFQRACCYHSNNTTERSGRQIFIITRENFESYIQCGVFRTECNKGKASSHQSEKAFSCRKVTVQLMSAHV
jgi:hypothetical protein